MIPLTGHTAASLHSSKHGAVHQHGPIPLPNCNRNITRRPRRLVAPQALMDLDASAVATSAKRLWLSAQHLVHGGLSAQAQELATVAEETAPTVAAAVDATATAATAATSAGSGPVDWLAHGFESVLQVLNDVLEKAGVPYSYGFAIILLTVMVKAATFPLTQKQVESTVALQALQPRVRELQARYADDPQRLQQETARLYQAAAINPLAGCLPTLATIPVFIGLYRALTAVSQHDGFDQEFFWIPSLAGPVALAQQKAGAGLSWLFPFVEGQPPIGWHHAAAYLVLPVLLVASQYVSQMMMQPRAQATGREQPEQQQTQAVLKFMPLMVGWFSLNVPAGLALYWFTNNILSTLQQMYLRRVTRVNLPGDDGFSTPSTSRGLGRGAAAEEERVKKLPGKRGSPSRQAGPQGLDDDDDGDDDDDDDDDGGIASSSQQQEGEQGEQSASSSAEPTSGSSTNGTSSSSSRLPAPGSSGGSSSKGDKFRARKAQEAAAAAAAAASAATASTAAPPEGQEAALQGSSNSDEGNPVGGALGANACDSGVHNTGGEESASR